MSLVTMTKTILLLAGAAGIGYGFYSFRQQCPRPRIAFIFAASVVCLEFAAFSSEFFLGPMGRATQGTVTVVHCVPGQKPAVLFQFHADRALVLGRNAGSESRCEAKTVGALGTVTYLPGDPAVHIWGSLRNYLGEQIAMLLFTFLAVGFCAFRSLGELMETD